MFLKTCNPREAASSVFLKNLTGRNLNLQTYSDAIQSLKKYLKWKLPWLAGLIFGGFCTIIW